MEEAAALPVPDDALAGILGRLPPGDLAASRCVCKAWRALVDARGLLLRHVLPHAGRGVFIDFIDYWHPFFFARPSSGFPRISGDLSYVPGFGHNHTPFVDHCNGLFLYKGGGDEDYVINPATRRWECLSSPRVGRHRIDHAAYLVFDPAVSPHYEVFWIPRLPRPEEGVHPRDVPSRTFNLSGFFSSMDEDDTMMPVEGEEAAAAEAEEERQVLEELARPPPPPSIEEGFFPTRKLSLSAKWRMGKPRDPYRLMEWPPSPCTFHVLSSSTRHWEERSFVREGEPMGTVEDARLDTSRRGLYSQYAGVYWQGTLYVHCRGGFVMRLSLKLGKYRVLKTPAADIEDTDEQSYSYLGRSIGGICFATMWDHQLWIWNLNESSGKTEWVFKHCIDLDRSALWAAVSSSKHNQARGPWMLMDGESGKDSDSKILLETDFEWDSDDDNIVDYEEGNFEYYEQIFFLGFHPFKDVVFLMVSFVVVAYHLSTSKVQRLGKSYPGDYDTRREGIYEAFPYTPCMIGHLLNHYETSSED